MGWCEANGVDFLFGLAKNQRLVAEIAAELAAAEEDSKTSGQPARRFTEFSWSTRDAGAAGTERPSIMNSCCAAGPSYTRLFDLERAPRCQRCGARGQGLACHPAAATRLIAVSL
jgi:hypothetical protein